MNIRQLKRRGAKYVSGSFHENFVSPAREESAAAYFHHGITLHETGNAAEAITSFQKAVSLQPDFLNAHFNLGVALKECGRLDESIAAFKNVISLDPGHAAGHHNLGAALMGQGRAQEALACFRQALHNTPALGDLLYWQSFVNCLTRLSEFPSDEQFREDLECCLGIDSIDHQDLDAALATYLRQFSDIYLLPEILLNSESLEKISRICEILQEPLILLLLEKTIITDPELETVLTTVRSVLLESVLHGTSAGLFSIELLECASCLAMQCYHNEYVFFQTREEERQVSALRNLVENAEEPKPLSVAVLGTYLPLHQVKIAADLEGKASAVACERFRVMVRRQTTEYREELSKKNEIAALGKITDAISVRVRAQYEEHPYPRWLNSPFQEAFDFADIVGELFPFLSGKLNDFPQGPEVLIAGCGTGKHAIDTAGRYSKSRVLACDLSLASLAYAIRKMRESGIKNLRFVQGDILELKNAPEKFDIIECVGVLHHLRDPVEGWRSLAGCLKEGGFMKIGLYSSRVREALSPVKQFISEGGYDSGTNDIRRFRHDLDQLPSDDPARLVQSFYDFFTVSGCRDLLFHAEEHSFTLPQVEKIIVELGLEFIGFETTYPLDQYRARFPDDPDARSLNNWHQLEQDDPDFFISMYQFWLRRRKTTPV